MLKLVCLTGVIAATSAAAFASDDPIAVRKVLMDSTAAAAAAGSAMLKEEVPFDPVVAKAVLLSLDASAQAFGAFFPEGSLDPASSAAAPAIWDNPEGFATELAGFREASAAAVAASGRSGPADAEAFAAVVTPVLQTCRTCHQGFRVSN